MMKHFILTQKYLPSTPSSADVANPAADVAFTLTPWEVAMASQPCFPTALLYGSGVYTTWRSNSAPNWVHAHLKRLQHHCHQLGWPWPLSSEHPALQAEHTPATLFQQLYQALEAGLSCAGYEPQGEPSGEYIVRLSVFPDVQSFQELVTPTTQPGGGVVTMVHLRPFFATGAGKNPEEGLRSVSRLYHHPWPTLKHLSTGLGFRLKQLSRQHDAADEVVWRDAAGYLREATTANVFVWQEGKLLTPPTSSEQTGGGCLRGITRTQVMIVAQALGIAVEVAPVSLSHQERWQGAFLTNAVSGMQCLRTLDGHAFPWPETYREMTHRLRTALTHLQQFGIPA